MINRGDLAKALGHAMHLDDVFAVFHLDLNSTSTGWPGCRLPATCGSNTDSIMNTSFALPKQCVVNKARLRGRLFFLVKVPLRLGESLSVLIARRAGTIVILLGRRPHPKKFFLSRELGFGKNQRRTRLIEARSFRGFIQSE